MCCTFSGYNAVHRSVLRNNYLCDSDVNIVACLFRQHWGLVAVAFMAEAGELKITYRTVVLPKFISVLTDTPDCFSASH